MSLDWVVLRADVPSLSALSVEPLPFGRLAHVQKLLNETFRGVEWSSEHHGIWRYDSAVLEVAIPEEAVITSLHLTIHPGNGYLSKAEPKFAAAFRKLFRRSGWCVFDVSTNDRVEFSEVRSGAVKSRREKIVLQAAELGELRSSNEHRRCVYLQILPNEGVEDVMQTLSDVAKADGIRSEWGTLEERSRIKLSDGTFLQGLSFRVDHPAVERSISRQHRLALELRADGTLVVLNGYASHLSDFSAYIY